MHPHDTTSGDVPLKFCPNCDRWLPANADYFHRGTGKHGFRHPCRQCRSQRPGGWIAPAQEGYLRCHTCLEEFPATTEFFALDKTQKRGFQVKCKKCSKDWRVANIDKIRDGINRFRAANPGKWTEYSRTYRKKNPGKSAEAARKRYAANPEKAREYSRRKYAANPQVVINASRKYARAHPQEVYAHNRKWRQRLRSLPISLSAEQWQAALLYWGGCCAYCGSRPNLYDAPLQTDHFIPLSSPGCPGTIPTNILPTCPSCNSSKNNKPASVWLQSKFGKRKAASILARIEAYFASLA